MRGYFGIGILNGKTQVNYGTLFRTAQIWNAAFVFTIGRRYKIQCSDTMKSFRHVPTYNFADFGQFNKNRSYDCRLIGIEILPDSIPLSRFVHPERACYLLGAEDSGLTKEAIEKCQAIVSIPGDRCLNVAVAGSIVLYDRITKATNP